MKIKFYLTTFVFIVGSLASFGQMANTVFDTDPMASDSADAVTFKFVTSLQQYVHEYILCRTVNGTTIEIGRQAGYEYMSATINYVFVDTDPAQYQNATYTLKMVDNMDTSLVTTIGTVMHSFVSVQELGTIAFRSVFPNPTSSQLNVFVADMRMAGTIELRDASGRLIMSDQLTAGQASFILDMEPVEPGTYVLSIRTEDDFGSMTVVKQ